MPDEPIPLKFESIDSSTASQSDLNALDKAMDEAGLQDIDLSAPKTEPTPAPEATKPAEQAPTPAPTATKPAEQPAPQAAPAADPVGTPPAAPAEPIDEEVSKIEEPKGMNKHQASNWKNMRTLTESRGKEVKRLASELQAMEAKLKDALGKVGQLDPNLSKEIEELRSFHRMFNIRNDAEFVGKYDKQLDSLSSGVFDTLSKHLTEDQLKALKGQDVVNKASMGWWQKNVLSTLENSDNPLDNDSAVMIKSSLEKIRLLRQERDQEIEKASKGQSEYFKRKEAEQKEYVKKYEDTVIQVVSDVRKNIPWANPQEIPAGATPQQIEKINEANKFYKEVVEPVFVSACYNNDPKVRAQHAMEAVLARRLIIDNETLANENTYLKAEIAKLRPAGRTVPENGTPPSPLPKQANSFIGRNIEDALEDAMRADGL